MKRGEIWTVNLNPGFGREIRKKRPALIISPDNFNKSLHTVIVIPFSSKVPEIIGEEMIAVSPDKENHLDKKSILLPVFIRAIDEARLIKKTGVLSEDKFLEVEYSLRLVLGLIDLS